MPDEHASWEEVLESIESPQRVSPTARAHLQSCPECAQLVQEARRILGLFADARLPEPPRELIEETLVRLRARLQGESAPADPQRAKPGLHETVRRSARKLTEIWGTLVADSLQPSPALRGSGQASPRTLLFDAKAFSIALSLMAAKEGKGWDIVGQVAPKEGSALPPGGSAAVESGEGMIAVPLSELGQFALVGMKADLAELSILFGESRIRLRIPQEAV